MCLGEGVYKRISYRHRGPAGSEVSSGRVLRKVVFACEGVKRGEFKNRLRFSGCS